MGEGGERREERGEGEPHPAQRSDANRCCCVAGAGGGGRKLPPPATQTPGTSHTRLTLRESLFYVAGGGGIPDSPATQEHGFVSPARLWIQNDYSMRHESIELDLDTCLAQEAKNWTDLNHRL